MIRRRRSTGDRSEVCALVAPTNSPTGVTHPTIPKRGGDEYPHSTPDNDTPSRPTNAATHTTTDTPTRSTTHTTQRTRGWGMTPHIKITAPNRHSVCQSAHRIPETHGSGTVCAGQAWLGVL